MLVEVLYQVPMYLNLNSENFSKNCRSQNLSIFALVYQFTSVNKEIESLTLLSRLKKIRKMPYKLLDNESNKFHTQVL